MAGDSLVTVIVDDGRLENVLAGRLGGLEAEAVVEGQRDGPVEGEEAGWALSNNSDQDFLDMAASVVTLGTGLCAFKRENTGKNRVN